MAFVFRDEKNPSHKTKNSSIGPGNQRLTQAPTISKSNAKTKSPKPMFPSEAWNPKPNKSNTPLSSLRDPAPTTSKPLRMARKLSSQAKPKISKSYKFQDHILYSNQELIASPNNPKIFPIPDPEHSRVFLTQRSIKKRSSHQTKSYQH